uniref:UBX domain-containing protein n=1 Tax=Elphidium margaritaceum TaxID=933848 RepID=A0A7S0TBG1_9EUKA
MAITAADPEVAKKFLKATSWDINTAMDRYMAFDGDASKLAPATSSHPDPSSMAAQGPPPTGLVSQTANMLSSAFGGMFGAQGQAPVSAPQPTQAMQMPPQPMHGALSQTDQDALLAQQLSSQSAAAGPGAGPQQPFIRAPDAAFQDQMIGPYVNQFGSSSYKQRRDQQENFGKDWQRGPTNKKSNYLSNLFSDPTYKFQGSLEDAKKKGARENKWILVNIQNTENFCSHCLNRDVWKDKELSPVVQESFVFYQWVDSTDDAKRVMNLYHVTKIPCILVLDPATGRQEHEFVVPDAPDRITQVKLRLLEFLDDSPNPKAKKKKVIPVSVATKDIAPVSQVASHEEQELQKAIQASLMESKEDDDATAAAVSNGQQQHSSNGQQQQQQQETMEESADVAMQEAEEEELESQPDNGDPNANAIRIRMPNGSVVQRLFRKDSKVSQLYVWCRLTLDGKSVSLLQTMPRLKLDDQKEKTLKELGLIRATLVCSVQD